MRLATFNIESLDRAALRPGEFAARISALRPILEALDADILCLQEVNAQKAHPHAPREFEALDLLLDGTRFEAFHRAHSGRPETGEPADVHNLVILSRRPIVAQRQVFHDFVPIETWRSSRSEKSEPPVSLTWDRPLLYAAVSTPEGPPIHVVNLHLRAPRPVYIPGAKQHGVWRSSAEWAEGYYLAARKRQGQALEARLFVETLFDAEPEARIAVCGDLNAEAFEAPTRLLQALPDDTQSLDMAHRRLEPLERRVAAGRRHTVIHDGRPVLLDHILASPKLADRCRNVDIFNVDLADEAKSEGPVAGSLHAPIVVDFAD